MPCKPLEEWLKKHMDSNAEEPTLVESAGSPAVHSPKSVISLMDDDEVVTDDTVSTSTSRTGQRLAELSVDIRTNP